MVPSALVGQIYDNDVFTLYRLSTNLQQVLEERTEDGLITSKLGNSTHPFKLFHT